MAADAGAAMKLSPRATEVRDLLYTGASGREIAQRMGIGEKTVKTYVGDVLLLAGVPSVRALLGREIARLRGKAWRC